MQALRSTLMLALVSALANLATACSGGGPNGGAKDAGTDAEVDAAIRPMGDAAAGPDAGPGYAPTPPTPPADPSPVAATPCPAGWQEVATMDSPVSCDPWTMFGRQTCMGAQVQLPGHTSCEPLGTDCAADGWPSDIPAAANILYVRAGATGGTGTQTAPFGTIGDAMAMAHNGDVIAIAVGDYVEPVVLPRGVTLWGACASGVRLRRMAATYVDAVVDVQGTGTELRNLEVLAEGGYGIKVEITGAVDLEQVHVSRATAAGVIVGGVLTGSHVAIRNISPTPATARNGWGLQTQDGAMVMMDHVLIERAHDGALNIFGATTHATLADSVLAESDAEDDGRAAGMGVFVSLGAHLTLLRCDIEDNHYAGIQVVDAGSFVHLESSEVRGTLVSAHHGFGIAATGASQIEVVKSRFDHLLSGAILAADLGTTAMVTDTVIENIDGSDVNDISAGIESYGGASVTVRRVYVSDVRDLAIADLSASVLDVQDAVLEDDHMGAATAQLSSGVWLDGHSMATLSRISTTGLADVALRMRGSSMATVSDFSVHAMRGRAPLLLLGDGILVTDASTLTASRVRIDQARDVGVFIDGSMATFEDLRVENTLARACATTTCTTYPSGISVGVYNAGAVVSMHRALLHQSVTAGIQVAGHAMLDILDGTVSGHMVGANAQDTDFDVFRLTVGVLYTMNVRDFDQSTAIPIPMGD